MNARWARLSIAALRAELTALPADEGYLVHLKHEEGAGSQRPLDDVLALATERLQQLDAIDDARQLHAKNGASFFTTLEGYLVAAHDRGLINENALLAVLRELLAGQPLTLSMLSSVFGVQPIYEVTTPDIGQVERLARRLSELVTPSLVAAVTPQTGAHS